MRLAPFILLTASVTAFSQTYTASNFAGVTVLPENVPAASVSLGQIDAIAADAGGNVFLLLFTDRVVIRVDAITGILTRVAGNGTWGFNGDNIPAINAQLNQPSALAVDLAGNLYIADTGNNRVRKVANGLITTVAGNGTEMGPGGDGELAASAPLNYPYGLATDSAGNLYIEDNSGIHKVTNGVITYVTGPRGYLEGVDGAGNVYVLDDTGARVLKVANGDATTVAGNGVFGSSPDGTPATSASLGENSFDCGPPNIAVDSSGNIYIADADNNRIREVSNGVITTVPGGGPSPGGTRATGIQLNSPSLIAVNAAGNLFITDTNSTRALEIGNGMVRNVAGNGAFSYSGDNGPPANAQFNGASGLAIDSARRVYVADTYNNSIRMIAEGVITTVAGTGSRGLSGDNGPALNAQLSTPVAVAVNPSGDLYIADTNNYRIRKISGGIITTVAGTQGYTPCSVASTSAGDVYFYDCTLLRVFKVANGNVTTVAGNGSNVSTGDNGPATSAGLSYVGGMAVDANGNLYLADLGRIRKVSSGLIRTIAGGTSVTLDAQGNLYVVDANLGLIRKSSNGLFAAFPANPFLAIPMPGAASGVAVGAFPYDGIAADSSGNIYESYGAQILAWKPDGPVFPPTSVLLDFVNNAASNMFAGLAPGEIVTFAGSGLGPAKLALASPGADGFYPTQLAGTSLQIGGFPAPLLYTSATQIAAVVPYEVTGAGAEVTVVYQGQASAPATVAVYDTAPALFTADGSGAGQAAAVNQDGSLNSASNPAPVGSVISLYAAGGGQSSPGGVDGKVTPSAEAGLNLPVSVVLSSGNTSDGLQSQQYAGAAPREIAGVLQVNVQIPADIEPGGAVSVTLYVGGRSSQNGVTIAVSAAGN